MCRAWSTRCQGIHTCARSFSLLLPPLAFSLSRLARTKLKKLQTRLLKQLLPTLLKWPLTPPPPLATLLLLPPTPLLALLPALRLLLPTPLLALRLLLPTLLLPLRTLLPLLLSKPRTL